MNAEDRESFYDNEIAPEMARLGKMCLERGLSMVCVVEYATEEHGRTVALAADRSPFMGFLEAFGRSRVGGGVNFDAFLIGVARHITERGEPHGSMCLSQMGLDPDPAKRRPSQVEA
jgi:hypothetical protein